MNDDIYSLLKNDGFLKTESQYKNEVASRKENIKKKKLFNKIINRSENESSDSESDKITATEQKNLIIDNIIDKKNDLVHIHFIKNKFKNELYDFEFINSESINNLKIGHIVRYVNLNDELKWGGILVKMLYPNKPTECILRLRNSKGNFWDIKFINFYIFFKYRNSKAENFQKLFLKMIDDI